MRRYSLTARRMLLALSCTVVASLVVAASAQAVVVTDSGTEAGVSIVPMRGASAAGRRLRRDRWAVHAPTRGSRPISAARRCPTARSATAAAP